MPIFTLTFIHLLFQTVFPLQLFPLNVMCFEAIVLAPSYFICALIPSSNSLNRKSITCSVTLLMMKNDRLFHPVHWFQFTDVADVITTNLLEHSIQKLTSLWSKAQSKLPTNIFNYTNKYLYNTLATRKNFSLWNLSATSDCFLQPESLLHIAAGCNTYLTEGCFTWRHNSALRFLAKTLQTIQHAELYVDLPGYLSPWLPFSLHRYWR